MSRPDPRLPNGFVPPEGREPTPADETRGELELTLRPGQRVRLDVTYLYTTLDERTTDRRILTDQIARTRLNWQFNLRLSLRAILQYDHTRTDPELTRLETTENWNGDLLLTYLINPWTAAYLGYNTNFQNLEQVSGAAGNELLRTKSDLLNDARQVFVKISYLFRP